jgi:hypothetical protein
MQHKNAGRPVDKLHSYVHLKPQADKNKEKTAQ